MAYGIDRITAADFIKMQPKLPRFQRKQTWGDKDNFKLCISVFKQYPIGVVIVNEVDDENWLLDGRQRLNALRLLKTDPGEVYKWAKKFISFKEKVDDTTLIKAYWYKIDEYIQQNFDIMVDSSLGTQSTTEVSEMEEEIEDGDSEPDASFNFTEQKANLQKLLDIIFMVHHRWDKVFDFRLYLDKVRYFVPRVGKTSEFSSTELARIISYYDDQYPNNSKEKFISFFGEEFSRFKNDNAKNKFIQYVEDNWSNIDHCVSAIHNLNDVISKAILGIIRITKASNLDAQNMFSLINKGGTQLSAGELLSAKPYWNFKIENYSQDTLDSVDAMYKQLEVSRDPNINVVRWDLCAVLLDRLKSFDKIVFDYSLPKETQKKERENKLMVQRTLGFKLIAGIYCSGISSAKVSLLESAKDPGKITWVKDYEGLITDLKTLCEIIQSHPYFKTMVAWKQNIMSLTSNTIALEFIILMYNEWKKLGKPTTGEGYKKTRKQAFALLDKLIYEYSTKMWRGSSDHKLETDIADTNRFTWKDKSEWKELSNSLCDGKIGETIVTQQLASPVLYHSLFLKCQYPAVTCDSYQIDHIIPQDKFKINEEMKNLKDCLANLEVLSSTNNDKKKDKELLEFKTTDKQDIANEIHTSSGIELNDFEKYSDIINLSDLITERKTRFESIFLVDRESLYANN